MQERVRNIFRVPH